MRWTEENHLGVRANDALAILPIEDSALEEKLPSGLAIYAIREVLVGVGPMKTDALAPKVKTLCTSAVVFARRDADPDFLTRLSDAVSLQRDSIAGKR